MLKQVIAHRNNLSDTEKLDWLRLIRTENIGPITFYKLLERYDTVAQALEALPELSKKGGRKKPLIAPPLSQIEKEYESLRKLGGDMICACEKGYPIALASTDDAPPVLSYIGNIELAHNPCLAIVGARNASLNGRKFATKLALELGQAGQTIVSGLARGIDTASHKGALATGTIAVVAGGINIVYPRENQKLYEEISAHGLIIAESPLSMEPIARHFPKRNRIVSGLSSGTIVVEATFKSGSLITARLAGEQGRDVYAVPGYPMDPRANGPNTLIQQGATLVQKSSDVLNALSSYTSANFVQNDLLQDIPEPAISDINNAEHDTQNLEKLLSQELSQMPVGVDELARTCHVSIPELQVALLQMELAGKLERLPGNKVALLDG